jgi:hypothetical protein
MVLVQFVLTSANNGTDFIVPISGKCSIRVLSVDYHQSGGGGGGGGGTSRVVQLQSDVLFFPYSPARFLTWLSIASNSVSVDNSHKEYSIYATIPGKINLRLVDPATGAAPANFDFCVVSLACEMLNRDFDLEH